MSLKKVYKNYSPRDRLLTSLLLIAIISTIIISLGKHLIEKNRFRDAGGIYTEGLVGEVYTLNPLFRDFSGTTRDISSLIYSGLIKYNPEKSTFEPDLATFTINEDSTIFTFKLKDNLFWQDSEPITAEDVIYTYRTVIQSPEFGNNLVAQNLKNVSIEITAINEIQFKLSSPNAFFLSNLDMGILPKHVYNDIPIKDIGQELYNDQKDLIIGSGPYKLENIEKVNNNLEQVTLKVSKKYYNTVPTIKQIRFFVFPTVDLLLESQNTLNSIPNLPNEYGSKLDKERFSTKEYILPQYTAIFFNTKSPILIDSKVREALRKATDKKTIALNMPTKQIISKPFFLIDPLDKIGETKFSEVRKILTNNGWTLNDQNIFEKNGTILELTLITETFANNETKNKDYETVAKKMQEIYKDLGVKLNIQSYDSETFQRIALEKTYDMILSGHNLGNNYDIFSFWHSSQSGPNGLNLSNYTSVEMDNFIEKLRITTDVNKRNELLIKINEKLASDSPAIFLYTEKHVFAFDNKAKNRKILSAYTYSSDRFYNVQDWILGD